VFSSDVFTPRSVAYALRVPNGDPRALLDDARAAVWAIDADLPLARVRTLNELVDESMAQTSFTLVMLAIAAGVALFLGSVGIYGVVSYVVAQRTREIGVRMAVGAQRGSVGLMVLRQSLALTGCGIVVGTVAALGLTRLMASLLFGVSPFDPITFVGVAIALAAVSVLSAWLPARRASRVDPVVALRFE
jgi:ABC-type antimicrobial peptide transport system permease subunit